MANLIVATAVFKLKDFGAFRQKMQHRIHRVPRIFYWISFESVHPEINLPITTSNPQGNMRSVHIYIDANWLFGQGDVERCIDG